MADAVTTTVLTNNTLRYDILLTNISDSTGESAVKKVDLSTLLSADGVAPLTLAVERIEYTVSGFDSVTLLWDHAVTDTKIIVLPQGHNTFEFCPTYLKDPAPRTDTNSDTGDILLTTNGTATAQDSYVIHIRFKVIPS